MYSNPYNGKKTKSKNSTWITIKRRISPISPPAYNMSSDNGRNGGDTLSDSGVNTYATDKVSLPKEPGNDAYFNK
ncbi:MAG: hypothetical protein M3299_03810 [Thermoproteota archaeon]|nr:hypothetical protein [Thermoproteota archaeon]